MSTYQKPVFFKVLDCSTAHITREDNDYLEENGHQTPNTPVVDCPVVFDSTYQGFLVYLLDREETEAMQGISDGFKTLMHWARQLGADYIKLDADGEKYPQLETFNW